MYVSLNLSAQGYACLYSAKCRTYTPPTTTDPRRQRLLCLRINYQLHFFVKRKRWKFDGIKRVHVKVTDCLYTSLGLILFLPPVFPSQEDKACGRQAAVFTTLWKEEGIAALANSLGQLL